MAVNEVPLCSSETATDGAIPETRRVPGPGIPVRTKLLVVIFAAFVAHAMESALHGLALFIPVDWAGVGSLVGPGGSSLANCLYFSAETYSSLGFGDLIPTGPVRLLAGVESLNGLLLIGWSASYAYIAMERVWTDDSPG
jgi:hypothetical protein